MIIPTRPEDREAFYAEVANKCLVSLEDRRANYNTWRSWYLWGNAPEEPRAYYSKIKSHLHQITSFIYSAETTRFSIPLGAGASETNLPMVPALTRYLNDKWHDSDTDMTFGMALDWALVYSTMLVKLIPRTRTNASGEGTCELFAYPVEPYYFGVLEEGLQTGAKQSAYVHIYYITKSELLRRLYAHPKRFQIVDRASAFQHQPSDVPAGVERIVLSQSSPTMQGTVNIDLSGTNRMKPQVAEETVEIRELYLWNDEIDDYQVVTMADPAVCIFDRPLGGDPKGKKTDAMFLKGEMNFVQVCANPMPDYWWGNSEVDNLIPLQTLRNNRLEEIVKLLNVQTKPPVVFSGFSGLIDEKKFAMDMPGSVMSSDIPNAKAERLSPDLPEDLFREVSEIDRMFSEASGIENVVAGRGEQGVRSAGHAAQLARLGSSRAKKRALIVEDVLERLATVYLKLIRVYDPNHLRDKNDKPFTPEQFTGDFMVKVDAHSNSPIFMEDMRALAFNLFKVGAISKELLIRMLQPPMEQMILEELKHLPPQQKFAPPPGGKKGGHLAAVGGTGGE